MLFLDYDRLDESVDPTLRTFLLSVFCTDTLRRAKAAFPEFFSNEQPKLHQVKVSDIGTRKKALLQAGDHNELDGEEFLHATLSWFGIKVHSHEQRVDRLEELPYNLLPANFKLEREKDYDGLIDSNPWLVRLSVDGGPEEEHLVLAIQKTDRENELFFIWTIETSHITF